LGWPLTQQTFNGVQLDLESESTRGDSFNSLVRVPDPDRVVHPTFAPAPPLWEGYYILHNIKLPRPICISFPLCDIIPQCFYETVVQFYRFQVFIMEKDNAYMPPDSGIYASEVPLEALPKTRWQRSWPVIACGAGLFSDGYLQSVCVIPFQKL